MVQAVIGTKGRHTVRARGSIAAWSAYTPKLLPHLHASRPSKLAFNWLANADSHQCGQGWMRACALAEGEAQSFPCQAGTVTRDIDTLGSALQDGAQAAAWKAMLGVA